MRRMIQCKYHMLFIEPEPVVDPPEDQILPHKKEKPFN
jgi:hypothetical protein